MKKLISNPLLLMFQPTSIQMQAAEASTAQISEKSGIYKGTISRSSVLLDKDVQNEKTSIYICKTPNVKFSIAIISKMLFPQITRFSQLEQLLGFQRNLFSIIGHFCTKIQQLSWSTDGSFIYSTFFWNLSSWCFSCLHLNWSRLKHQK